MPLITYLLLSCALAISLLPATHAADTPFEFDSPERQAKYQQLLEELRCLVCQNQSLADSHADLAQDLRDEVYRMLGEGKSDEEIRDFMVSRYGDFVLYKPPMRTSTSLLWFGPFILIVIAGAVVWRTVVKQNRVAQALSAEEQQFIANLGLEDRPKASSRKQP